MSATFQGLIGDTSFLNKIDPAEFIDEKFGIPTIKDIVVELDKPGRDPRPEFKAAEFKDGIEDIRDLKLNMELEGSVTNVTNFGAFVDIGVHQDGLVHISALSESFVKDPRNVVKAGDIVKVKVMEVDVARKRIGLTMRLSDKAQSRTETKKPTGDRNATAKGKPQPRSNRHQQGSKKDTTVGTFADLFANAKKMRK